MGADKVRTDVTLLSPVSFVWMLVLGFSLERVVEVVVPFLLKLHAMLGRGCPSNVQEKVTTMVTNMATLEGSSIILAGAGWKNTKCCIVTL